MRRVVKRREEWMRVWRVWRMLARCWRFAESALWAMTRWLKRRCKRECVCSWTWRVKARVTRVSWARKVKKARSEAKVVGLVGVSCLTGIGYPPQLRALHENFIHPRKILYTHGKFMKNFIMKPPQKFNEESPNLIRFSNIYFYKFPI